MPSKVTMRFDAETAKAVDGFLKLEDKQKRLEQRTKKLSQTSKRGAKAHQSAISDTIKSYASMAAAVGLVTKGIQSITRAFQENERAAKGASASIARYAALNDMTPESREFLFKHAGMIAPEQASQLAFSWKSAGFSKKAQADAFREVNLAMRQGESPEAFGRSLTGMKQGVFADRSLGQISSFLGTMAERSPLSASDFAQQFLKVGGVAGLTDRSKASGGALISGIMKAMGAEAEPELATTATKGFLIKRQTVGKKYLKKLGLEGKGVSEQVQALSKMAVSGEMDESRFLKAFGERTGPYLMALLRSPSAVSQMEPDIASGVAAIQGTGPSMFARKGRLQAERDPQQAALWAAKKMSNRREIARTRRGYQQADWTAKREAVSLTMEDRGFGSQMLGAASSMSVMGYVGFIKALERNNKALEENTATRKEAGMNSEAHM